MQLRFKSNFVDWCNGTIRTFLLLRNGVHSWKTLEKVLFSKSNDALATNGIQLARQNDFNHTNVN